MPFAGRLAWAQGTSIKQGPDPTRKTTLLRHLHLPVIKYRDYAKVGVGWQWRSVPNYFGHSLTNIMHNFKHIYTYIQEAKLVTYVAGPVKSTVDYIMVRQDKAKVRNVKVISSEEYVPKHKLLVMDMWFEATKSWHRKFEPRVRVWKLKEEKTCEEYRSIVGDKVEAKWKGLGVNDHWQQMKDIMMETAQDICGMTKGPCRHNETTKRGGRMRTSQ